jgi:hypothetical protein
MKKKNTSTVTISPTTLDMKSDRTPLYLRLKSESTGVPAYVEIDPKRRYVRADNSAQWHEPMSADERRFMVFWVPVPAEVTGEALIGWLTSPDNLHLLERVCDGWSEHVDPSGIFYGALDDDASEALEEFCINTDAFDVHEDNHATPLTDVGQVLGSVLSEYWPEGPLEDAVEASIEESKRNGEFCEGDWISVTSVLLDCAETCLRDHPELLSEHHIDGLLKAGRIDRTSAAEWHKQKSLGSYE